MKKKEVPVVEEPEIKEVITQEIQETYPVEVGPVDTDEIIRARKAARQIELRR